MKYMFLAVAILALYSTIIAKKTEAAPLTLPFGGKVLLNTVPGVICVPPGMGPVVTMGNAVGQFGVAYFAYNSDLSAGERIGGAAISLYSVIPFYTTDPKKVPKPGGYILGRHLIVPSMQYCNVAGAPFPVKQTTVYSVSK